MLKRTGLAEDAARIMALNRPANQPANQPQRNKATEYMEPGPRLDKMPPANWQLEKRKRLSPQARQNVT